MKKRFFTALLSFIMIFSLLPMNALAAGELTAEDFNPGTSYNNYGFVFQRNTKSSVRVQYITSQNTIAEITKTDADSNNYNYLFVLEDTETTILHSNKNYVVYRVYIQNSDGQKFYLTSDYAAEGHYIELTSNQKSARLFVLDRRGGKIALCNASNDGYGANQGRAVEYSDREYSGQKKLDWCQKEWDFECRNMYDLVGMGQIQQYYTFELIYNVNGGDANVTPSTVSYGPTTDTSHSFTVSDQEPTREGYKFLGWADDRNATEPDYSANASILLTVPSGDSSITKTIYAVWGEKELPKWTVSYNWGTENVPSGETLPDGATDVTNGAKFEVDTKYTNGYEVEVKDGYGNVTGVYTFSGWNQSGELTVNSDITITGSWSYEEKSVDKWTVSYNWGTENVPSGETLPDGATDVTNGAKFEVDTKYTNGYEVEVKDGYGNVTGVYTFSGWNQSGELTVNSDITITGSWSYEAIPTTPGTFDFDDIDGNGTPAVTKTVTGNVGTSFTDKFKVIVEGTDALSKAAMTGASYTGTANVTYSDRMKVAFDFGTNSKLSFDAVGTYAYTVQEVKGKTDRMSYDTTEYTLTIKVVLNDKDNVFEVESWQFTPSEKAYGEQLDIVNTYRTYRPSTPSATKPALNTADHYAYVMGYPDGTVQPGGYITRAEASTIFFRLLTDETREQYWATTNAYSDIKSGDWYNNAISTLSSAGIVSGYPDGTFRPNAPITRAEMSKIIALFAKLDKTTDRFSDIAGHWAEAYIKLAAGNGWIEGYPDGTFKPQQNITRAETVTMINRVLERVPSDEDHLLSERVMLTFPDCKSGDWFYIAIQEATNSHTYERAVTEKNGDEQWTALRANRDWTLLEK